METSHLPASKQRGRYESRDWNGTRIVIAGRAEAWLFDVDITRRLRQVATLADDKARLHDRDLVSDRPGRVFDHAAPSNARRGVVARHAADGERSPGRQRAILFARRIVAELDRDRRRNRFRQVVLIAGPAFLGLLREALKEPLARMVVSHAALDLMHRPVTLAKAQVRAMLISDEL